MTLPRPVDGSELIEGCWRMNRHCLAVDQAWMATVARGKSTVNTHPLPGRLRA